MALDEFGFIHRYFANLNPSSQQEAQKNGLLLGIGDDAALVKTDGTYAITSDTLIENVHFFNYFNAQLLGARSLEVNFSDLYAMGAKPRYVTLSLNIPERYVDFDVFWSSYAEGFAECLQRHGCTLIGGNISRMPSPSSPLVINVTAFGKSAEEGKALYRNKAQVGDLIVVTNFLGCNGLYVKASYNGSIRSLDRGLRQNFEQRAFSYDERMGDFVELLVKYSQCAIDISDGLLGDLSHILVNSRCRAILDYESLPLDPLSKTLLPEFKLSQKSLLKLALSAGGDYNLLFTISPKQYEQLVKVMQKQPSLANFPITVIGEVTEASDDDFMDSNDLSTNGGLITIVDKNKQPVVLRLGSGSYNHFIASNDA